ncbi:GNAT family N-acetyltransferase [Pedobacter nutrimenti]|uniref:RimJ/RimL family protein N-acetyltransferase n=1 Tax=Pedobacter nutrimenti TaxID=1241337 RepID=A0A318UFS6_9SPHI|nr:GNAT family N-acetyltransferase [Pedobacter nutrimenti]PYF72987.1 RimJ/RimL family protein N-acetyltransferase [Pedobacter nutrimenti]
MISEQKYIFTSERLGFRNWLMTDVEIMAEINSDEEVMEFFPGTKSRQETTEFIERMQHQFQEKGFCYYAVDKLETSEFIGFIGLSEQVFAADFTPCIDIGWRLKRAQWNKGYATEGAKRCLDYAFNQLKLEKVMAIAPTVNLKSEQVMKKIGMKKTKNFNHPGLADHKRLQECTLYEINAGEFKTIFN